MEFLLGLSKRVTHSCAIHAGITISAFYRDSLFPIIILMS